ncbi:hypothetical protein [Aquimarina rhabdastrellae]
MDVLDHIVMNSFNLGYQMSSLWNITDREHPIFKLFTQELKKNKTVRVESFLKGVAQAQKERIPPVQEYQRKAFIEELDALKREYNAKRQTRKLQDRSR